MKNINYRVPNGNIEKYKNYIEKNEYDFDVPSKIDDAVSVTMGMDSITVGVDTTLLGEEIKEALAEFIDVYMKRNNIDAQIDLGDNLSLSFKDELYSSFDEIIYYLSKEDYLRTLMFREGYNADFFKNYIKERFDIVSFCEELVDVTFNSDKTKIIDKGKLIVPDKDYANKFLEKSNLSTVVETLDDIADITNEPSIINKNDINKEASNELSLAVVNNEYNYAIDCYSKEVFNRLISVGNVNKIYIKDAFDCISDEEKDKLDKEDGYINGCDETDKFYEFCKKYCVNEEDFIHNKYAFYKLLDLQLVTYRVYDKKIYELR